MGPSGVLVGGEAQVEALQEFLHGAPGGRPPVMLVAGEAGGGKTALVDHALAGAGQPGRRGWGARGENARGEGAGPGPPPSPPRPPPSTGGPAGAVLGPGPLAPRRGAGAAWARPAARPGQPVGPGRGGGRGPDAHGGARPARRVPR